jgi:hypothetical protein
MIGHGEICVWTLSDPIGIKRRVRKILALKWASFQKQSEWKKQRLIGVEGRSGETTRKQPHLEGLLQGGERRAPCPYHIFFLRSFYSSILKMEAPGSVETLVPTYHTSMPWYLKFLDLGYIIYCRILE